MVPKIYIAAKKGVEDEKSIEARMELCGILTGTHEQGDRAPRDPGWRGSSVSLAICFTTLGPTLLLQLARMGGKGSAMQSAFPLRTWPQNYTHCKYANAIDPNLATWMHLHARGSGKCSLSLG